MHVAVRKLLAAYGDEVGSITATGHSLGEPRVSKQSGDDVLLLGSNVKAVALC